MTRQAFNPKTQLQDEREITRLQEDFSSGVFKDIPASKVPENGVVELKNMTNFGTYLQARSGSREWGDYGTYTASAALPSLVTGIASTSTATGITRTITISSGYTPTADSVGDWFIHDDGTHERITAYNSPTEIETYTDSTAAKTSTAAKVRAQTNCLYFHNTQRKTIMLIGQKLYISNDYTMTSWTQVTFVGNNSELPANSVSQIEEFNNTLFLFNSNGIYKFYLDQTPYLFYKLNVAVPEGLPTTTVDVGNGEYTRRYTYTNLRLSGTGLRDRNTEGVVIETETGNTLADSNYKDYGSATTVSAFGDIVPITIDGLNVSTNGSSEIAQHFTHIGIYATLDIGDNGVNPVTGRGNNTELYIWLVDVPIYKHTTVDYAGVLAKATDNTFASGDIFNVYNPRISGQESVTITALQTATTDTSLSRALESYNTLFSLSADATTDLLTIGGVHGITSSGIPISFFEGGTLPSGLNDSQIFYATNISGNDIQVATTYAAAISGTPIVDILTSGVTSNFVYVGQRGLSVTGGSPTFSLTCSQNASGVLTQDPYSFAFGSGFVGKTIYVGDNTYRHITSIVSASGVNVAETGSSYVLASGTAGAIDVTSVSATDVKTDVSLRDMIAGWTLNNRFYEPLPNSDIATIVPGYMAVATRDENKLYYSQMPEGYEYLTGYYHPGYQYANFKGSIRALAALPNLLVIYCAGSTHTMPLNVFDERKIEELGISIAVIAGQNVVDDSVGLLDYGSLANVDRGRHIMITNEPAIRVFDGYAYSENIASQRIMDDLRSLQAATSAIYHNIIGYVFWGNNE